MGHVVALEPTSVGRRGLELSGSAGAQLYKEARPRAT
jgi:hypothetical protein